MTAARYWIPWPNFRGGDVRLTTSFGNEVSGWAVYPITTFPYHTTAVEFNFDYSTISMPPSVPTTLYLKLVFGDQVASLIADLAPDFRISTTGIMTENIVTLSVSDDVKGIFRVDGRGSDKFSVLARVDDAGSQPELRLRYYQYRYRRPD